MPIPPLCFAPGVGCARGLGDHTTERAVLARPRLSARRAVQTEGVLKTEVTGVTRLFVRLFSVLCNDELLPVTWANRGSTFDHFESLFFTVHEVIVLNDFF